ncbi:MAG: ATP-binding protein [Tepidisphaerales bacterium]
MTVRRRIILKNFVLLGSLLLIVAASGVGLLFMRHNLRIATDEYLELRMVNDVAVNTSRLELHLAAEKADKQKITSLLKESLAELDTFARRQQVEEEPEDHDLRELQGARRASKLLSAVLSTYEGDAAAPALSVPEQIESLGTVMSQLDALAREMDSLIKSNQREARKRLQTILWIIAGLTATIVLAGAAISRSQYQSIARPVKALRAGVKRLAAAKFSERLPSGGDREFAELAEDFNRMAAELDDFYRRLEEKVEQKSKELVRSERLASVGFLAAGVAHEINNPLGIISGNAELAMRRLSKPDGEEARRAAGESLQIIWDEAFRCKEITDRLLSLVRPGQARRQPVSLGQIARDTANLVNGLEQYRGRTVVARMSDESTLTVLANATEMRQVLLNLVVNALGAVEEGRGEVVIAGQSDGEWVEIAVSDNGRGMAPEVLEHVFEPLFTARRGTGAPGTGLGLSISQLIVGAHGGTIRAESAGAGKGSRFVVRLPVASQLQEVAV